MPNDELSTVTSAQSSLAERVGQQIKTVANPDVADLLQARADVYKDSDLAKLFEQAFLEDWTDPQLVNCLAEGLNDKWGGSSLSKAKEAAQYLVDEYTQVGEGVHLVSTDTGRIIFTLTENDTWQPAPVPRLHGGMAKPLPQIRPELASYLTTWTFDRSHEKQVLARLAEKGHQTALLREYDPRLLMATKEGRATITRALSQFRPEDLLKACGGTSAAFLSRFDLVAAEPTDWGSDTLVVEGGEVHSRSVMGIQDQTTVNLHHNRPATMRGALTQGWVREVANCMVAEGAQQSVESVRVYSISKEVLGRAPVWVAPPEAIRWIRRADTSKVVLPVEGLQHIMGLVAPKVGAIRVPDQFALGSRELFGRWETETKLEYSLWVDWSTVTILALEGLEYQGAVVS